MQSRRDFLKNVAFASTSVWIPRFLHNLPPSNPLRNNAEKTLIVIQLSGGNDGLNTIVPYRNDIYYKNRPTLGKKASEVLKLNDELGFNAVLEGLKKIYDDGSLSIINSVGYPNPDRSHFRSMDIWQTASGSKDYLTTGWLGRYLDHECTDCTPYHALEVDDNLSLALKGVNRSGFAVSNARKLKQNTRNRFLETIGKKNHKHEEENVAYLYKTMVDTQQSANYLFEKSKTHRSTISYPQTAFAKDLKQVAELMTADTATKIYYINLGGFDTHAFQKGKQERLLKNYAEGINAFVKDLKHNKLFEDTLILTFSEFGRRVKQNASGGTDHGTANNVFLIGGKLKTAGLYNDAPNLLDLDNGDLKYQIDFRQVYATILDKWFATPHHPILGKSFDLLNVL